MSRTIRSGVWIILNKGVSARRRGCEGHTIFDPLQVTLLTPRDAVPSSIQAPMNVTHTRAVVTEVAGTATKQWPVAIAVVDFTH